MVLNDSVADCFIWKENIDGNYTAADGYKWLLDKRITPNHHQSSWMWIWKLKTPEKIKFFIWCVCHQSIPTLSMLHKRNMSQSVCCSRCLLYEETIFHCLRDCSTSKKVWHGLGFMDINFFSNLNLQDWIRTNSTSPSMCLFLAGL